MTIAISAQVSQDHNNLKAVSLIAYTTSGWLANHMLSITSPLTAATFAPIKAIIENIMFRISLNLGVDLLSSTAKIIYIAGSFFISAAIAATCVTMIGLPLSFEAATLLSCGIKISSMIVAVALNAIFLSTFCLLSSLSNKR